MDRGVHHPWRSVQGHPLHQTKRSPLCRVHQPQKYLDLRQEMNSLQRGLDAAQPRDAELTAHTEMFLINYYFSNIAHLLNVVCNKSVDARMEQ